MLLAEAYEQAGFTTVRATVEDYRDQYLAWLDELGDLRHQLHAWDRQDFWLAVRARNPRISLRTQAFVDQWVDAMRDGTVTNGVTNETLRMLIANREAALKGKQARLTNQKLLGQWGGGGGGGLDYRWGTVKTIVTDIHEGLARV